MRMLGSGFVRDDDAKRLLDLHHEFDQFQSHNAASLTATWSMVPLAGTVVQGQARAIVRLELLGHSA